jgi:hypothetical protein
MKPASPVIVGLEQYEIKFGEGQPEYQVLPALRSSTPEHAVMSRWEPTRQMIANGADIFVSVWTFGNSYPPTLVRVLNKNSSPDYFREELQLDKYKSLGRANA